MTGRRHLTSAEAIAALRRGAQIEQLLPLGDNSPIPEVVRWLTAARVGRSLELRLHEVEDVGTDDFLDVSEFPPLDRDEDLGEGRVLEEADDPDELLAASERHGASDDRWVNFGVVQDEYADAHGRS